MGPMHAPLAPAPNYGLAVKTGEQLCETVFYLILFHTTPCSVKMLITDWLSGQEHNGFAEVFLFAILFFR